LSDKLGQQFIARTSPARQQHRDRGGGPRAADGYTVLLVNPQRHQHLALQEAPFNFPRDIAPVGGLRRVPM